MLATWDRHFLLPSHLAVSADVFLARVVPLERVGVEVDGLEVPPLVRLEERRVCPAAATATAAAAATERRDVLVARPLG